MTFLSPELELTLLEDDYELIVGIDEVGRGCLAGPVMVGAYCYFNYSHVISGVNDSKKLSFAKRNLVLAEVSTDSYLIAQRSAKQIDLLGIANCIQDCIEELAQSILLKHPQKKSIFLIDGRFKRKFPFHYETIIKGDEKIYSIAVASIAAKVFRDKFMDSLSEEFPRYGWQHNKGYGTNQHIEQIKIDGLSKFHRVSFCKNFTLE